jgi:hypothetical protein
MLLEYLTSKGNYCETLSAVKLAPYNDKSLTMNSHLETKHYMVCEILKDRTKMCERWQLSFALGKLQVFLSYLLLA